MVAISDITIIETPVTNPATGPRVNPLTKVRVSVKPTAINQPYSSGGMNIVKFPILILATAPTAIRAAVSAIRLEQVILISRLDYPANFFIPASLKPLVNSLPLMISA